MHHLGVGGAAPALAALAGASPVAGELPGVPGELLKAANFYLLSQDGGSDAFAERPVNLPGLAHLCAQSRTGDRVIAEIESAGARLISPPEPLGTGYHYAYGRDAAGRLFELESASFLPESPDRWVGHVAFVSTDAERLAHFYGELIGATVDAGGRFRGHPGIDRVAGLDAVDVEVWWVRSAPIGLEFWRYHNPPAPAASRPAAHWYPHLGLEVPDVTAACARVSRLGGTASSIGSDDHGSFAWASDPDGNRILLLALAGAARACSVDALAAPDALAAARSAAR